MSKVFDSCYACKLYSNFQSIQACRIPSLKNRQDSMPLDKILFMLFLSGVGQSLVAPATQVGSMLFSQQNHIEISEVSHWASLDQCKVLDSDLSIKTSQYQAWGFEYSCKDVSGCWVNCEIQEAHAFYFWKGVTHGGSLWLRVRSSRKSMVDYSLNPLTLCSTWVELNVWIEDLV